MKLNKGNVSSAVGRERVLLGWFHRSTDCLIPTVTLIDLARPPFLLSTVKWATGTKQFETLYENHVIVVWIFFMQEFSILFVYKV